MRGTKGKQHVQSLASWWTLDASMKDTDLEYMVWLAPEIRQRSSSLFFFILLHCCQLAGRLKRSSSPWLQQTFWNTLTNNDHLSMIFFLFRLRSNWVWTFWYASRATCTVSIHTVSPFQDSAAAERAHNSGILVSDNNMALHHRNLGCLHNNPGLNAVNYRIKIWLHERAHPQEATHVLFQLKQWLMEVWAAFEQINVDKQLTNGG